LYYFSAEESRLE